MTGTRITVEEGRGQIRRIGEQLEAICWQLIGIKVSLSKAAAERVRVQDVDDEMDAATELQATIDCVLNDDLRPAIQDLKDALASTGDKPEEG